MCDEGRLGYHYVNSSERFLRPMVRRGAERPEMASAIQSQSAVTGVAGTVPRSQAPAVRPEAHNGAAQLVARPWTEVIPAIRQAFKAAAARDAASVVGVLSPFLTCEEAYLLARFLKGLSGQVRLALGPVPVVGEDDTYPKDRRGRPVQPVKFTIRAEKCPNRRGVEEVLRHFQGDVVGFDDVVRSASDGGVQALYLAAGYLPRPGGWVSAEQAQALRRVPLVVLQDLLPSPVSEFAHYVLPGASFAEKDGTFVNHAGLAQAIHWGVIPAGECRSDGQVFLDLLERRGLVHAPTLRAELAAEIPYFAPLAGGNPGEYGIPLETAAQGAH
jgi:NADH-quinone oxidoreductase subunit G